MDNGNKAASNNVLYSNIMMESPDGTQMCFINSRKARWYLKRNLAEIISPETIRLTFEPLGKGKNNDKYYLTRAENKCVVCGTAEGLTKHHVVPYCYRKFFPREYKDHTSHDVNLLCRSCHDKYETIAEDRKAKIAKKFKAPLRVREITLDKVRLSVKKAGIGLIQLKQNKIPFSRRKDLVKILQLFFKREDITEADIKKASKIDPYHRSYRSVNHGEFVVSQLKNIQEFIREWREHFVSVMCPQFMPLYWDVNKCERSDKSKRKK